MDDSSEMPTSGNPSHRTSEFTRKLLAVGCSAVLAASLFLGLAPAVLGGTAVAGDAAGVFSVDPEVVEVEPGETVELEVVLNTDGGYGGEGLYTYEYTLAYPDEYVTVTEVEHDFWFDAADDEVETSLDHEEGAVTIHHERNDSREGDTGVGTTATFTVEIAEDAPPADIVLEITDADGTYTSQTPMATFPVDGTLVVGFGGEEIRPEVDEESNGEADDDLGITTPTDDGTPTDGGTPTSTPEVTPTDRDAPTDGDDGDAVSVPGFGVGTVLAALAVMLLRATKSRKR